MLRFTFKLHFRAKCFKSIFKNGIYPATKKFLNVKNKAFLKFSLLKFFNIKIL